MIELNCSRNSSTNGTIGNVEKHVPIMPSAVGYAIAGSVLVWISCVYVMYLTYHFIKYIRAKPPNLQTMLDGIYIQLFVSWITLAGMAMILELLIELGTLNVQNDIITEIFAWLYYSSVLFTSISIGTSCIARILLIIWPSSVEYLDDETAWFLNG